VVYSNASKLRAMRRERETLANFGVGSSRKRRAMRAAGIRAARRDGHRREHHRHRLPRRRIRSEARGAAAVCGSGPRRR